MKIDIITIFPEMFSDVFKSGIIGRAINSQKLDIKVNDLRNWTHDKHKQVDDRPFGGGPGMILKPEPLFESIESLKTDVSKVIYLSPKGEKLTQEFAENLSKENHLILICGRYEGIDQRVIDKLVDIELSIGDYVLSGGEIPSMVLVDTIGRLIPGVILNEAFNKNESFSDPEDRKKLDHAQYTRPDVYRDMKVPNVLLSGDHKRVELWRRKNSSGSI